MWIFEICASIQVWNTQQPDATVTAQNETVQICKHCIQKDSLVDFSSRFNPRRGPSTTSPLHIIWSSPARAQNQIGNKIKNKKWIHP